jgi:beta-N-acetylhexosaminidase
MSDLLPSPGALFMAGLPGGSLDDSTLLLIDDFQVNNFILFKRNFADPLQLQQLCQELRQACLDRELQPPLIAIDQEGGSVTRLGPPFTRFPDARVLAAADDPQNEVVNFAVTCARELLGAGINMNLAPVLDICESGENYFMERRSLGADPEKVSRLGCLIIETMQKSGLAACAKHFPGLGGARQDPHQLLPVVDLPGQHLLEKDLQPFISAAQAGVAAVMTSHTMYPELDNDRPATLSRKIITTLLRQQVGYEGLVITDDLEMGAIENEGRIEDAAWEAFQAGADMLLICRDHNKVERAINKLAGCLQENRRMRQRFRQSLARIEAVQKRFSVI